MTHRILFTEEGTKARILLAIDGFTKKSPKTPLRIINMALRRRDEWRSRGSRSHGGVLDYIGDDR